jgi:spermidine/putrescine transport system substrate-binding protein
MEFKLFTFRSKLIAVVCGSIVAYSLFSTPANARTVKPSSPAITKVSVSGAKGGKVNVKVTISLPVSNGGSKITSTKVFGGGKTCLITKKNTSCTLKNLKKGKEISIRAASKNSRGTGKSSLSVPFKLDPKSNASFIYFANWTDYFDPNDLMRFTSETGIHVIESQYDSNETLLDEMQSGIRYDVAVPSDYMVQEMISLNLLTRINTRSMQNGNTTVSFLDDVYWDPTRSYSAPYLWGSTGIACNTRLEPDCENINSWNDLFTGNYPKVNALKDQVEIVSAALRATGVPASDLCTTDPAKYAAAQAILAGFRPELIDNDGGNERMITGEVNIRTSWNGDTHRMKMENPDIIFIYPSEGLNFWADNFVVPKNAANVTNAKKFINWMMDPRNAASASNFTGYMNGIEGSDQYLSSDLLDDPAVNVPANKFSLLSPAPSNCSEQARELYSQVFINWLEAQ